MKTLDLVSPHVVQQAPREPSPVSQAHSLPKTYQDYLLPKDHPWFKWARAVVNEIETYLKEHNFDSKF